MGLSNRTRFLYVTAGAFGDCVRLRRPPGVAVLRTRGFGAKAVPTRPYMKCFIVFACLSIVLLTMSSDDDAAALQSIGHDLIQFFVAVVVETFAIGMYSISPRTTEC